MPTILVVDDDEILRETIGQALGLRGYTVCLAANAALGVELARARFPDLILSDICMQDGDGYSLLSALRADPVTAAIPCVLMTGQSDTSGMRRGMEAGADDYLFKPFSQHALYAAVEARLKKQTLLKEQAEQRLQALRLHLSLMLPHELRTPLSGILGLGDLIATEAANLTAAELRELGRNIIASGHRLQRLIQNFLLYAETEFLIARGEQLEHPTPETPGSRPVDLAAEARGVADRHGRPADLTVDLAEAWPALSGDILRKVLEELLDNAFKFSSPGTPVALVSHVEDAQWRVSVRDRGRGLTPEQIAQVGAYLQFDRRVYEQQGTGLGLTIARRLVQLHRGDLTILSEPGRGTEVVVHLPLAGGRRAD